MSRASAPKSRPRKLNTKKCSICGIKVIYMKDVKRHNLLHKDNVDGLKTPCPYPGCTHKSLQKSNVAYHAFRKHGVQIHYCSVTQCTYSSLDMASVMEHREQVHKPDPWSKTKQQRTIPCPPPRTKTKPTPPERQTTPDITANARSVSSSLPVLTTVDQVTHQRERHVHPIGLGVPSFPEWLQWDQGRETLVEGFTADRFFQGQEQSGGPLCISLPRLWDGPLPQTLPWSPLPQETITPSVGSKNEVDPDASTPSFIDGSQNLPAFNTLEFSRIMESWNDMTVSLEADPDFVYDMAPIDVDSFFSTSPPILDPLVGFGLC